MASGSLERLNRAVVELTTGRHDPYSTGTAIQPAEGYRLLPGFLSADETAHWLKLIDSRSDLFAPVSAKAGMSLAYNVLDGIKIDQHLPELRALANGPLLRILEETFGLELEPMTDIKRSLRVQRYRSTDEGFKWHLDGGLYSVILTLLNTNDGFTEVLSPEWSRVLFPVPYLLFPFARLLEFAKPKPVKCGGGDLVAIKGGEVLHRGVTPRATGERIIVGASYNPAGTKPTPAWDWFARKLNY